MQKYFLKVALLLIAVIFLSCKKNTVNSASKGFSIFGMTFFKDRLPIDSVEITNLNSTNVTTFYRKYNFETVWIDKGQRDFILNEINSAENEGLQPKDYNFQKLQLFEKQFDTLSDRRLIEYDLLLTYSVQDYILHISCGKLNPKNIYKDWDLKEKVIDVSQILFDCFDKNDFSSIIEDAKPNHLLYKQLKESLQILKKFSNDTLGVIDLKEKIVTNKANKNVILLKYRLLFWGDLQSKDTIFNAVYDKNTVEAIKIFQARHGLLSDGIIGRSTIDALNFTKNQRIEQVIANLERWKWYAHNFENHYLLINIPDYKLVAIKNNNITQAQRIVVGKDTRKTPILESKISNINLNPNWTVPPTILKEDIFPEAEKDKSVFKKKGLKIVNADGDEVNPSIWTKKVANKYKYVQKPSYNNSLGVMKINFPNRFSVYLHDTNHRNYFDFWYRSLSSGCVRLEKPLEMAEYLINDADKWNLQTLKDTTSIDHYKKLILKKEIERNKKLAKQKIEILPDDAAKRKKYIAGLLKNLQLKTIVISIKEPVYIHQLYWTAWVTNNKLQFREDIYCLDHDLYARLRYEKKSANKL